MKDYSIRVPVQISADGMVSRMFDHSIKLKVNANTPEEAVARVEEVLLASLAKQPETTNQA